MYVNCNGPLMRSLWYFSEVFLIWSAMCEMNLARFCWCLVLCWLDAASKALLPSMCSNTNHSSEPWTPTNLCRSTCSSSLVLTPPMLCCYGFSIIWFLQDHSGPGFFRIRTLGSLLWLWSQNPAQFHLCTSLEEEHWRFPSSGFHGFRNLGQFPGLFSVSEPWTVPCSVCTFVTLHICLFLLLLHISTSGLGLVW